MIAVRFTTWLSSMSLAPVCRTESYPSFITGKAVTIQLSISSPFTD